MKKSRGFTLIELLIVTVVIVTLMAIIFRLAGSGSESTARAKTLARLQKLSNALSGYYAAFGCYPPVPLQGRSRNIYTRVSSKSESLGYGIQSEPDDLNTADLKSDEMKRQIEAACRAQPVAAGYPLNPKGPEADVFKVLKEHYDKFKDLTPIEENIGAFNLDSSEWSENHVFMFGLMSFLLPRYQFMLSGTEELYDERHPNGPWPSNNRLPFLLDGTRLQSWAIAQEYMHVGPRNYDDTSSSDSDKRAMLENLPSQAVCARWMPNFKNLVTTHPVASMTTFFGVDTEAPKDFGDAPGKWFLVGRDGSYNSGPAYINGTKTVLDGWGEEFYYYSPPPYQSYQLWSSGPNKRTFPPWMEPESGDRQTVNKWIADDIKVGDK